MAEKKIEKRGEYEKQRRIVNWDKERGEKREVNQSTEEQGCGSAFI
jgi:hypothetical protein